MKPEDFEMPPATQWVKRVWAEDKKRCIGSVKLYRWEADPFGSRQTINQNGKITMWNIYAYIYPGTRFFEELHKDFLESMEKYKDTGEVGLQDCMRYWTPHCAEKLDMHGGATYCQVHWDNSGTKITSFEIGCDYNHLHDGHYNGIWEPDLLMNDVQYLVNVLLKLEYPTPEEETNEQV